MRSRRAIPQIVGYLALVAVPALLAGCRPDDMYNQARHEPFEEMESVGLLEEWPRRNVPGTVARGHLRVDELLFTGKVNGEFAREFPAPVDDAVLAQGRKVFNIFCANCHGLDGSGQGMVVRRGFKQPPLLYDARLRDVPHGYLFDVITNGFGVMPALAAQIKVPDRWAVVAYVRALQLSQHAELADLERAPELVEELEQQLAAPQPAAPLPEETR